MLVLQALQWVPMHGYGIAQKHPREDQRCLAGGDRFSIPGLASVGVSGLGQVGVEAHREQATGKVLRDYSEGQKSN